MSLSEETFYRLTDLLPRLAAITDKRRLKVLSDIDRVLAAESSSWTDIADHLMPPNSMVRSDMVLSMIARIEDWQRKCLGTLTDSASSFLGQLLEQAPQEPAIRMSHKQYAWLRQLFDRADKKLSESEAKPVEQSETNLLLGNVISFPQTKAS
jgi:hypothetical protein